MAGRVTGERTAALFPGQGSQSVGMRAGLGPDATLVEPLFERAEAALGLPLRAIIDAGPPARLMRTAHAQPALLVMGVAHATLLERRGFAPDLVLGHSLGAYTALVRAGSLAFEDALRLVHRRGALMEAAAADGSGAMAALVRVDEAALEGLLDQARAHGIVERAGRNAPAQLVVSGERPAVEALVALVEETRAGRAVLLDVAAPFHCSLMAPAAAAFREALAATPLAPPRVPWIDDVEGGLPSEPAAIRARLLQQLTEPVDWEAAVRRAVAEGVTRFVEVGPGGVLASLTRRIAPGAAVTTSERLLREPAPACPPIERGACGAG